MAVDLETLEYPRHVQKPSEQGEQQFQVVDSAEACAQALEQGWTLTEYPRHVHKPSVPGKWNFLPVAGPAECLKAIAEGWSLAPVVVGEEPVAERPRPIFTDPADATVKVAEKRVGRPRAPSAPPEPVVQPTVTHPVSDESQPEAVLTVTPEPAAEPVAAPVVVKKKRGRPRKKKGPE